MAAQNEFVGRCDRHRGRFRTIEARDQTDLPRAIGGESDDDHLVGGAGEDLSGKAGFTDTVRDRGDAGFEIQLASIIGDIGRGGKGESQIAESLVGLDALRQTEQVLGEFGGFGVTSLEQGSSDFGQRVDRLGIGGIAEIPVPERILVELKAFFGDAAEHHGPDAAIADWQSLIPVRGGLLVPEHQRLGDWQGVR